MLDQKMIEEIILGMADIVIENRMLRQQVKDLDLENRKNEAYARGDFEEGERLSDLFMHNLTVKITRSSGVLMSNDELKY